MEEIYLLGPRIIKTSISNNEKLSRFRIFRPTIRVTDENFLPSFKQHSNIASKQIESSDRVGGLFFVGIYIKKEKK